MLFFRLFQLFLTSAWQYVNCNPRTINEVQNICLLVAGVPGDSLQCMPVVIHAF
ncbi:hypothetical protein HanXRQr2_Chr06g0248551 [Helianthus annuus]|uniref:Secreted protein n=1 Tax=Helianthus annuus TaxID=4232 RepID=A0A9K3IRK9_HELAN|nr:hypothetical protein HanXRQr2_Chr06g0248551 [Helianthus annuus]